MITRSLGLKVLLAAALLVCVLILSGCGSSVARVIQSPFTGQWNGPWADIVNTEQGQLSLTVARDGDLSGTISNTTLSTQGSVEGSVSATGQITATLTYPGAAYTASGVVVKNTSGNLVGTLQTSANGSSHGTMTVNLEKD